MREVMLKTQELGQAILDSEEYKRSKELEQQMLADPEAARLLGDYMEKQNAVKEALTGDDESHARLAEAGAALQKAESALRANPLVQAAQEANKECNAMMENVNRLLQLIVNGKTDDEGGCTGSCATCNGCH